MDNEVYVMVFVRFEAESEYYVQRLCMVNNYNLEWIKNLSAIIVMPKSDFIKQKEKCRLGHLSLYTEMQLINRKR